MLIKTFALCIYRDDRRRKRTRFNTVNEYGLFTTGRNDWATDMPTDWRQICRRQLQSFLLRLRDLFKRNLRALVTSCDNISWLHVSYVTRNSAIADKPARRLSRFTFQVK